jgi:hypothetical protein
MLRYLLGRVAQIRKAAWPTLEPATNRGRETALR